MSCPALAQSYFGFYTQKCCKVPCPNFPAVRVNICVQVNQVSKVIIQQGCKLEDPDTQAPCKVDWRSGFVASSWGDKFRRVTYSYWVPLKTMIRIRVCPNDATGCTDSGSCPVPLDDAGNEIPNRILRFEINGVNYARYLNTATGIPRGSTGCLFLGCQDYIPATAPLDPSYPSSTTCCHSANGTLYTPADYYEEMPWGGELIIGPVGTPLPFGKSDNFVLSYNSNGGSGTLGPQTGNTTYTILNNTFTRSTYAFNGWNTAADGSGLTFSSGQNVTLTSDVTLYAQWQFTSSIPPPIQTENVS